MIALSRPQSVFVVVLAASGVCAGRPCVAQLAGAPTSSASDAADMAMPDDLGAPLRGSDQAAALTTGRLSVDMPIAAIASSPQGKSVLEHRLPGLCERPEYMMFKSMSVAQLAGMSQGRISPAKVASIQAELVRVDVSTSPAARFGLFARGERGVRFLSRAVYRRMLIVVGSL